MRLAWPIGSLIGFVILLLIWSNPFGRWTVSYCPVSEGVDAWPISQREIVDREVADVDTRQFMVHGGELYLAVQATRPSLFITTFVRMPRWDAMTIRSFRDRHPEFEAMWPTPSRDDGGVQWARTQLD